jgi:hypothetical protein
MMSGRRVWCGPLMENWLTASHSLRAGVGPVDQPHEVAAGFAVLLVLHRHAATSSRWNCRFAASSTGVPRSSTWLAARPRAPPRHAGFSRAMALRSRPTSSTWR